MPLANAQLFGPQHTNAIAKDIRELYTETVQAGKRQEPDNEYGISWAMRRTLEELALKFARRFNVDNENFDVIRFLELCSPDNDLYPITELWDNGN